MLQLFFHPELFILFAFRNSPACPHLTLFERLNLGADRENDLGGESASSFREIILENSQSISEQRSLTLAGSLNIITTGAAVVCYVFLCFLVHLALLREGNKPSVILEKPTFYFKVTAIYRLSAVSH